MQGRIVDDDVVQEAIASVCGDAVLVAVELPAVWGCDGVEVRHESGLPGVHRDVAVPVV
ncbi:hypothetical protein ACN27J_29760 [Solwaraspora sp. WMMB762]|uniref:hypothetical protein n=1 Tax=Solwaraspora sp. WMMB762 TaxID=3404120 RepID=UPI003B93950E